MHLQGIINNVACNPRWQSNDANKETFNNDIRALSELLFREIIPNFAYWLDQGKITADVPQYMHRY